MFHSRRLRLFFDYADPASFLLERRLRLTEGPTTFHLDPQPFELVLPPSPRPSVEESETFRRWETMADAGRSMGIRMTRPWIVPWTRKAHELARHAGTKGCFREIHDTLFRAYFVEGADIGRVDILVGLGGRHGLEPMDAKAALDIDLHESWVVAAREEARELGVSRTPTLIWLEKKLEGYPEEEDLARFLAQ